MKKNFKKVFSDTIAKWSPNKTILLIIVSLIAAVILYSVFLLVGAR